MIVTDAGSSRGDTLTVITIASGFVLLFIQLIFQNRQALKLQKRNARNELGLSVYKTFNEKVRALSTGISATRMYASFIPQQLANELRDTSAGVTPRIPDSRAQRLLEVNSDLQRLITAVIIEIEAWEIAFEPNGGLLFRTALSCANRDAQIAFHALWMPAVELLPLEINGTTTEVFRRPELTAEVIATLKGMIDAYVEACDTISSYVYDLNIELQNHLLFDIFERRTPLRKPIDPSYKVVTTRNSEALLHYFNTQTVHGIETQKACDDVLGAIQARERGRPVPA